LGNSVGSPEFFASACVVTGNKAAVFEKTRAASDTVDHFTICYDWSTGIGIAFRIIGDFYIPTHSPGSSIQRYQVSIRGGDINHVFPHRQCTEMPTLSSALRKLSTVFP
jgi:hypothetical protein